MVTLFYKDTTLSHFVSSIILQMLYLLKYLSVIISENRELKRQNLEHRVFGSNPHQMPTVFMVKTKIDLLLSSNCVAAKVEAGQM